MAKRGKVNATTGIGTGFVDYSKMGPAGLGAAAASPEGKNIADTLAKLLTIAELMNSPDDSDTIKGTILGFSSLADAPDALEKALLESQFRTMIDGGGFDGNRAEFSQLIVGLKDKPVALASLAKHGFGRLAEGEAKNILAPYLETNTPQKPEADAAAKPADRKPGPNQGNRVPGQ